MQEKEKAETGGMEQCRQFWGICMASGLDLVFASKAGYSVWDFLHLVLAPVHQEAGIRGVLVLSS